MIWTAEYLRDNFIFNIQEIEAASQKDAEMAAWDGYMHLADCITIKLVELKEDTSGRQKAVKKRVFSPHR